MKITVLGAGSWGSALAISLAARHDVMLWGRNSLKIQEAQNSDQIQGFSLPKESAQLTLTSDFEAALAHLNSTHSLLIIGTSVAGLRPTCQSIRRYKEAQKEVTNINNLVWLCKGLEEKTLFLPHQVVEQELGNHFASGALSGPSFALEVANGLPCALTIASQNSALRDITVQAVHSPALRVYSSQDVVGVEVGGAVKNIMAIATGVSDGLGLGLNARAALMTRGLAEITRLGLALGGQLETFMGLTGMGDLLLTCTGDLSRNRRVGLGLAEGKPLSQIVNELGHVAEGVLCVQAVQTLSRQYGVDMPITNAVAGVLFNGDDTAAMVKRLMARDAKAELQ